MKNVLFILFVFIISCDDNIVVKKCEKSDYLINNIRKHNDKIRVFKIEYFETGKIKSKKNILMIHLMVLLLYITKTAILGIFLIIKKV